MEKEKIQDIEIWRRQRYVVMASLAMGYGLCYMSRTSLSIAIVAMTDRNTDSKFPTFNWDQSTQGLVLSSYAWGYVPMNFISALLLQRFGARWVLLISTALGAVASLLIPIGAQYGDWPSLCALRLIQGATHGPYYSSFGSILALWSTPGDRARMASICNSGSILGIITGLSAGGTLASSAGGWPSIFYVYGALTLVWCILWGFLGYSKPADHPFMTSNERDFIEGQYSSKSLKSPLSVPWAKLLSSPPVWAVILASCSQCWTNYTLLTEMPTYISAILKYNLNENGLLSAAPFLAMLFSTYVFGWLGDVFNRLSFTPKSWNRKIFTSIAFIIPAISMIALTVIDESSKELAIWLLVIGVAGNAALTAGYQLSAVDIAPNFAAIIAGIMNGTGNITLAIVPVVAGAIITDKADVNKWNIIFWISAGAYIFGTIAYGLLGSQEIQPWNNPGVQNDEEKGNNEEKVTKF